MNSQITAENKLNLPAETTASRPAAAHWLAILNRERLAQILTGVNLVALAAGWFLEGESGPGMIAWLFYGIAYLAGGYFGVQAGWKSLMEKRIDVDLLMVLAALGAALVGEPFEGALLLFLFSLSNVLQNVALDRTRSAIRALMNLRPPTALVRQGNDSVELPIEEIQIDEIMLIRPGEQIALDGRIVEGESAVDQSSLTGESMPVSKRVGDEVLAGTINMRGGLEVRVTRLAGDSTLARLIQLVEQAQSEKATTERFIDRAEQIYAAGVIIMTLLAIAIPLWLLDHPFQPTFYRAMTLMVAASPCALVISTPATVLSAIGNGARRGILFKGGAYVEQAAALKVIAFDKTGTLTIGRPVVTEVQPLAAGLDRRQLLALAGAVEARSEHPLALAIVQAAEAENIELSRAAGFQSATGRGVAATVDGQSILVGSPAYLQEAGADMTAAWPAARTLQEAGQTAVAVGRRLEDDPPEVIGLIALADTIRPGAAETIARLKQQGITKVVMLTGDNERVGQAIAAQVGVDDAYTNLLPEDKLEILKTLEKEYGPVAMVGDGVNDAPALATATIGIAMGAAGTDVALETADVVFMGDDLAHLPYMIGLSRQTRRVLVQNLAFATGVIVVLIAAVLGFNLALPLSVVGHEGSTVLVSLNGMRLLAYRN